MSWPRSGSTNCGMPQFPAEQARIVPPLFNTRAVELAGIAVDPRHHGVGALVREMLTPSGKEATA